jgi:hypothetical protein
MINFLRDPVWQLIVALLTLAAAFWIYWLQRQTKELAFGLVSSMRPLTIADELSSRVTVQLDGKHVGNLHLLVFGLKNSGHRAIATSDWERRLSISFDPGLVVSAEIASQTPSNIGAQLTVLDSRIELAPLLLNPGDQLLVQVLLSSAKPNTSLDARVLDVSSFAPINTVPRLPRFMDSAAPNAMVMTFIPGIGIYFFGGDQMIALTFIGSAVLFPISGLVIRLRQDLGRSARRRINDA